MEKYFQLKKALMADAVATTIGACLGTSTVTTYIESAAGIAEGGKTGLSSVVTGLLFLAAIFAAPLFGVVSAAATAPALIIVGVMMMASVTNIDFNELSESIPAFLTIVLMPFTYKPCHRNCRRDYFLATFENQQGTGGKSTGYNLYLRSRL